MAVSVPLPALLLDASLPTVRVACVDAAGCVYLVEDTRPPTLALSPCIQSALDAAGLNLPAIKGFFHCEGPGSILGIRLSAMTIRTWLALREGGSCHTFRSLNLARDALLASGCHTPFRIGLEFRRGQWALLGDSEQAPSIANAEQLQQCPGSIYALPSRTAWQQHWPDGVMPAEFDYRTACERLLAAGELPVTDLPDAYVPAPATYQPWSP